MNNEPETCGCIILPAGWRNGDYHAFDEFDSSACRYPALKVERDHLVGDNNSVRLEACILRQDLEKERAARDKAGRLLDNLLASRRLLNTDWERRIRETLTALGAEEPPSAPPAAPQGEFPSEPPLS